MLFLAIQRKARSRKDEGFLVQKSDVKNSLIFVRNSLIFVSGLWGLVYTYVWSTWLFYLVLPEFLACHEYLLILQQFAKLKDWILWSIIQSGWAIGLSKQSGALRKLFCSPNMHRLWGFHICLHVEKLSQKWSATWKTVKIITQNEAKVWVT